MSSDRIGVTLYSYEWPCDNVVQMMEPFGERGVLFYPIVALSGIYGLYCVPQGMLQLILATDMARHKEILDSLQNNIKKFEWESKSHMDSVIHVYWELFFFKLNSGSILQAFIFIFSYPSLRAFFYFKRNDPFSHRVYWMKNQV